MKTSQQRSTTAIMYDSPLFESKVDFDGKSVPIVPLKEGPYNQPGTEHAGGTPHGAPPLSAPTSISAATAAAIAGGMLTSYDSPLFATDNGDYDEGGGGGDKAEGVMVGHRSGTFRPRQKSYAGLRRISQVLNSSPHPPPADLATRWF